MPKCPAPSKISVRRSSAPRQTWRKTTCAAPGFNHPRDSSFFASHQHTQELVTFQTLLIARSHARHSIKQRLRGHRCNNIGSSTRLDLGPSSTEACHCSTPPLSPAEQSANGRFFQGSGHCWWITLRMRDYFLHPPAAGHPSAPHPLAQPKRRHLSSSRVKVRLLAVSNEVDDAYAHKTAQGVAKLVRSRSNLRPAITSHCQGAVKYRA
jgi:hypothetical protein